MLTDLMLPELLTTAEQLRVRVAQARAAGRSIGLVPTMGALHAGHASLVDASHRECGLTVATIFVNPTQFGPDEDFSRYPRTLEGDLALLGRHGTDCVFAPPPDQIYPPGHETTVDVGSVARPLEGAFRPGHFQGVATVVLKLFLLARPDVAFFGRKDYQQTLIVRRLIQDFGLPIQLRVCPTIREPDGLALSSRNRYLTADERQRAQGVSRSLALAARLVREGTVDAATIEQAMREELSAAELAIDYVALADPETLAPLRSIDRPAVALVAVRLGKTRLIDNEPLRP
ncbi:MAG TPA: pantoate--beta-alanine ligase [Pirellulales bacterium]|jgi:pantoate--beta-alanine ligase|nr:pantoate--beta-alanine ligase [Pirellulales bacterium]